MSRTRRRLSLGLAALACSALAACGGGDGSPAEGNEELFTTGGFERAVEAVADEAGDDASALRVQITERGAEFQVLGEESRGFIYTGGELEEAELQAIGVASLSERAFPLSEIDPGAIDRLVEGAADQGGEGADPVAITLERSPVDGQLRWTINTRTGGAYSAGPDGSDPMPASAL